MALRLGAPAWARHCPRPKGTCKMQNGRCARPGRKRRMVSWCGLRPPALLTLVLTSSFSPRSPHHAAARPGRKCIYACARVQNPELSYHRASVAVRQRARPAILTFARLCPPQLPSASVAGAAVRSCVRAVGQGASLLPLVIATLVFLEGSVHPL